MRIHQSNTTTTTTTTTTNNNNNNNNKMTRERAPILNDVHKIYERMKTHMAVLV
jgi:hypothetical protein